MKKSEALLIGLSIVLLAVIILGVFFGCSACSSAAERKRLAALEAERLAAEEAARLEAEQLAAEEAARLEAERLAAEQAEEAARQERERLEAERLAAARRSGGSRQTTYQTGETDPNNPLVGTWANANRSIVFRCRPNGNVEVINYTLTDTVVEVYWRTNRALTNGGFYDTRNPEPFESSYTGAGTYTIDRNTVTFRLDMKNHLGTAKTISHTTRFSMNTEKDTVRFTSGLARNFIINRDTREQFNTRDFVTSFIRQ